jgi:hypothetical protein
MDTATKTRCEAVDQIVRWEQVQEGDLTLHNGRLELVIGIHVDELGDGMLGVLFEGCDAHQWLKRDGLTAVARYIETEAQS